MLFGIVVGFLFGVPRIHLGNVILEPHREIQSLTRLFIPSIVEIIFPLHQWDILEFHWISFLLGLL